MSSRKPTVIVTGIAGNLGLRLLPQLGEFTVVGLDLRPPAGSLRFEPCDVGREASCHQLVDLCRQVRPDAVVHLAFVIDPLRTGILDVDRMWQINVAGTARVMEAISVYNRDGGAITKFVFPSSVSAYGPDLPDAVSEDHPLGAHTLPYAMHKQESDEVVRLRAASLGACTTYLLRPHIFTGATMKNYLVGALRGHPGGRGRLAAYLRDKGRRLPLLLPRGDAYLARRFQFLHVDDMARLIAAILRRPDRSQHGTIVLNVAGRGDPVTLERAARIAKQKVVRLPSRMLCRWTLELLWALGISDVPPDALPYMIGSYVMDTRRLRAFLGPEYEQVIRYTCEQALADSFAEPPISTPTKASA